MWLNGMNLDGASVLNITWRLATSLLPSPHSAASALGRGATYASTLFLTVY